MTLKTTGVILIAEGASKFLSDMGGANKAVDDFGKTGEKSSGLLSKLGGVGLTVGKVIGGVLVGGIAAAGTGIAFATKEAISLESAFAGVIKTTDGLADSSGELTDVGEEMLQGFRDLAKDAPIAIEELMGIGELGGQLGIARDDLLDFTETIAAVGTATNLTTEEAAVGFAQMANIMGTPTSEIENMASALVALGNNMATTESDIFNFATNIAGAGKIAGLTEAQVLGIGAAFSSVGIEAAAGGTATQKVLLGINDAVINNSDNLEVFAKTAGIAAEDFGTAWEESAGEVFTAFVMGLGDAGDDAVGILQDLGLQDQRLIKAFLSLASAGDLVNESINLSQEAFRDNTALMTEAEARYRTTESQIQIFKNTMRDVGFTVGSLVLPILNSMLENLKPLINAFGFLVEGDLDGFFEGLSFTIMGFAEMLGFTSEQGTMFADIVIEAIQRIWDIITQMWEGVKTVFALFSGWFVENGPGALTQFKEIFATVWGEIQGIFETVWSILGPSIGELIDYLGVVLPEVIQIASDFWNNVLMPTLTVVWDFISGTLIPIIATLVAWVIDQIPGAISVAKSFWENVLLPALTVVFTFISGTLIPIIETTVAWLQENIPAAISTASDFWENTLKPALDAVWQFVDQYIIPIFDAVVTLLEVTLTKAIEGLSIIWTGTLKPALDDVWKFIDKNIIPIFTDLSDFVDETISPILQSFTENGVNLLSKGLETLKSWLEKVLNWVNKLADAVAKFSWGEVGEGAMPKSPPKLAVGFSMITDEAKKFGANMSALSMGLSNDNMGGMLAGVTGALQSGNITPIGTAVAPISNNYNQTRSLTINFEGNYASQPTIKDRHDLSFALGVAGVMA